MAERKTKPMTGMSNQPEEASITTVMTILLHDNGVVDFQPVTKIGDKEYSIENETISTLLYMLAIAQFGVYENAIKRKDGDTSK